MFLVAMNQNILFTLGNNWQILNKIHIYQTDNADPILNFNQTQQMKNRIISYLSKNFNNQSYESEFNPNQPQTKAERRLFYSFNQLLLSIIAPRLMRYQFDLMMSSVISEIFRKIFVPAIGNTFRGNGNSGGSSENAQSILSSPISQLLLRNRPNQNLPYNNNNNNNQLPQLTIITTPTPPSPVSSNLDIKKLLDNAQKLITLQTLIRNGQQPQEQITTTTTTTVRPVLPPSTSSYRYEANIVAEKTTPKLLSSNKNNNKKKKSRYSSNVNDNDDDEDEDDEDNENIIGKHKQSTYDYHEDNVINPTTTIPMAISNHHHLFPPTTAFNMNNPNNNNNNKVNMLFQSNVPTPSTAPIHLAISTNDFIDFLRNKWNLNYTINRANSISSSSSSSSSSSNAFGHNIENNNEDNNVADNESNYNNRNINNRNNNKYNPIAAVMENEKPKNIKNNLKNFLIGTSSKFTGADDDDNADGDTGGIGGGIKKYFKQKAKLNDFKLSHLTYIDTDLSNYGNQLLINEDSERNSLQHNDNKETNNDNTNDYLSYFSHSFHSSNLQQQKQRPETETELWTENAAKLNDIDSERAHRWNDVLSNMKRFG